MRMIKKAFWNKMKKSKSPIETNLLFNSFSIFGFILESGCFNLLWPLAPIKSQQ